MEIRKSEIAHGRITCGESVSQWNLGHIPRTMGRNSKKKYKRGRSGHGGMPKWKKSKKDKRDKKDKRLKAGSEEGPRGRKRSRDFDHADDAPPDNRGPSRARAGSRDYASMQADPPRRSGAERGGAERGGADSYWQWLEPESSLGGGDRRDTSRHGAGLHRMDTELLWYKSIANL